MVQANRVGKVFPLKFMAFVALGLKLFGIATPFKQRKVVPKKQARCERRTTLIFTN